jgi:regulator of sigma E protease
MISTIVGIIGAVLVIAFMIIAHEAGHFFMGRTLGFAIDKFAIGFGPKLFSWKKKETDFSVRLFPIGGFCLFRGEDENSKDPMAFNNQPPWKRFLTVVAGAVANLISALILAILFLSLYGDTAPVVYEVGKDTPAYEYGLQTGDVIKEYEGQKIDFSIEMSFALADKTDDTVLNLLVERDGQEISFEIPKEYDEAQDRYLAGFSFEQVPEDFTVIESIGLSFKWLSLIIKEMLSFLGGLLIGTSNTADMGGIVSVVDIVSQAFYVSFGLVLELAALLSINLAVINLLPLPALDGGRLVFIVIEGIRKKPIPREVEGTIHAIGMFLLFGLMILLTFKDVTRIFFGG